MKPHFYLPSIILLTRLCILSCSRTEVTSLRAVDAIDFLPLSPSAEEAKKIEFHYNEWGRADYVLGSGSSPTAPFRATVRVLRREPGAALVELATEAGVKGWVPEDWLSTCEHPIAKRENTKAKDARRDADAFLRLTRSQVEAKLGPPKQVLHNTHPSDGPWDTLV